jgi:isopenicillin-N epimerase
MNHLRDLFMLDPKIVFLNHGSFGATPKEVFEVYQEWQRKLEQQPVKFLGREISLHLKEARDALGQYLNVTGDDLSFVPNATFGVNIVARSLKLTTGDEVLTTDHEYGACDNIWEYLSQRQGFSYKKQAVTLPVTSRQDIIDQIWQGVNQNTKVLYLSHITSPTALTFPVEELCAKAKAAGIMTVIDGAHVPGQLPLDLSALDADFYTGNCHKWLCSAKGAGFLYVRSDLQHLIEPLVIGWGLKRDPSLGSKFLDYYDWLGTNDFANYLSVPAAITFHQKYDWPKVRQQCHTMLNETLRTINAQTGCTSVYADDSFYSQMAIVELPNVGDATTFKNKLYDDYNIEIPLTQHSSKTFARISVQGYNHQNDLDILVAALGDMLL